VADDDTMLTDDEIAALTPAQRRALITRLSRPVDEIVPSRGWLRRSRERRVTSMVAMAVVLVPWIVYLAASLPRRYVADHWDATWVGFDVLLLALIAATAFLGWRRRQLVVVTGFATGTLLVCDAWFDVLTAHGEDRVWSLLSALVVELPLAAAMVAGSLQVFRLVAARLWVLEPGAHSWQVPIPLPSEADAAVRRRPRGPGERRTVAS
jgi:hypothetical protein